VVVLSLADRLGIAPQQGGDRAGAAMIELGGLDGGIPPAILLREGVARLTIVIQDTRQPTRQSIASRFVRRSAVRSLGGSARQPDFRTL